MSAEPSAIPRHCRKQRRTRPMEYQREKLDALVSDHGGGLFLGFLLYTSCRRGEVLALQWQDIDLDAGQIHITKSVTPSGERSGGGAHQNGGGGCG